MKRFLILFMVLGLIAGTALSAEAKRASRKRVERTVEGSYGPSPALVEISRCDDASGASDCVVVGSRPTETFFTANVTDAHGRPVYVEVSGGGINRGTSFCGETSRPIYFDPGSTLEFRFEPTPYFWSTWGIDWTGPLDCPYRIKTTGTITVTLSNLP